MQLPTVCPTRPFSHPLITWPLPMTASKDAPWSLRNACDAAAAATPVCLSLTDCSFPCPASLDITAHSGQHDVEVMLSGVRGDAQRRRAREGAICEGQADWCSGGR